MRECMQSGAIHNDSMPSLEFECLKGTLERIRNNVKRMREHAASVAGRNSVRACTYTRTHMRN
jgi:hypothetical protein